MSNTTNVPYVKHYDENGVCVNPISGTYTTGISDRRKNRELLNKVREQAGIIILDRIKYHRIVQRINGKNIIHYIVKTIRTKNNKPKEIVLS